MSCAPVGYLNVSKTDKTPADVIIDEERAPKVKRLFEEYAKGGRTLQDITNLARTLGLCSKMCRFIRQSVAHRFKIFLKTPFILVILHKKAKFINITTQN